MKHFFILLILLISLTSQGQDKLWSPVTNASALSLHDLKPDNYLVYSLDWKHFKSEELAVQKRTSDRVIEIPYPDGNFRTFKIYQTPVFDEGLSAKYPGFMSYTGRSADDPSATLKMSVSPFGIHAMVLSAIHNTVFIDPVSHLVTDDNYLIYYKKDLSNTDNQWVCEILDDHNEDGHVVDINASSRAIGDCQLRSYRLALACTGEYAAFHGGTIERVLAAFNTTMTRVNGVYERDAGITMKLIADTDKMIFLNSNSDPYSNEDGALMLRQNQTAMDNIIGTANYDIGHVFSTGGGGIAQLRSPCGRSKAMGVTGQSKPIGDPFDIDYVAHEMGHQFGANHVQNNNCNRNNSTAVEPGSGSSIMGYAGICDPNVQNNSDPHFNGISLLEIASFVTRNGDACAEHIEVNNLAPEVTVSETNYTIPIATPFVLSATATDADGDAMTYCWEQINAEIATMPPVATATKGPSFRSLPPSISPSRYFPDLLNRYSRWEVLPSVSRKMNFRCTVRDNHLSKGCTDEAEVTVNTTIQAGPFVVTYPNSSGVSWQIGSKQNVLWDVANTDKDPVNCKKVDIYLSTDGGQTYPHLLVSGVDNTGSHEITVPSFQTQVARIMVKAADNIFYDISNFNFKIVASYNLDLSVIDTVICTQSSFNVDILLSQNGNVVEPVQLSIVDAPAALSISFSENNVTTFPNNIEMEIKNVDQLSYGGHRIIVQAASGAEVLNKVITIYRALSEAKSVALLYPTNNQFDTPARGLTLEWEALDGVQNYTFQVSESVTFDKEPQILTVNDNRVTINLEEGMIYYWRVKPNSNCLDQEYSDIFSFRTQGKVVGDALLLKNNYLIVDKGQQAIITKEELNVAGTQPEFIIFTVIEAPLEGTLKKSGEDLGAGAFFTMKDIESGQIGYLHAGGENDSDVIRVSVIDDANRWIPDIPIHIRIKQAELGGVALKVKNIECYGDNDGSIRIIGYGGVPPYQYSQDSVNFVNEDTFTDLASGSYKFYIRDAVDTIRSTNEIAFVSPNDLTFTSQLSNYDIVLSASGGTGDLQYSIDGVNYFKDPIFLDPGNGLFSVYVKDIFGCTKEDTIEIDIPILTVSGALISDAECAGQTITIEGQALGGIPPYAFSVDDIAYNEADVIKTTMPNPVIYVKDAGGKKAIADTIFTRNPAPIEMDYTNEKFVVTIIATGGTGTLMYSNNKVDYDTINVFTFDDNGTYRLYVRDDLGCTKSRLIVLNVLKEVNVISTNVTCHNKTDGTIKLNPKGGFPPYQFKLNNGSYGTAREWTGLKAGDYTFVVKESKGDSLSGTVTIINPDSLTLEVQLSGHDILLQAHGGTPPYQYSIDGGNLFLDTNQFTELDPSTYEIEVKDANGCLAVETVTIVATQDFITSQLMIYPNPSSQMIRVTAESKDLSDGSFKAVNGEGRVFELYPIHRSAYSVSLDISKLPSAMYLLIYELNGEFYRVRFVKY